jgi:hypothetical protein
MAMTYPLFSSPFSQLRELICAEFRRFTWLRSWGCRCLHHVTYCSRTRLLEINQSAPSCIFEHCRMSRFSPGRVEADELIVRFGFHPIHFDKRSGLKPSIFSHAETRGCSVQRDKHALEAELARFVSNFLEGDDRRSWRGVVTAACSTLRGIRIDDRRNQGVCIYDTAEKNNPAHGEFGWSSLPLGDGDANELRAKLMQAFGGGNIIAPTAYREVDPERATAGAAC